MSSIRVTRLNRSSFASVVGLCALLGVRSAQAQSGDDAATAQALFDAGKKAMEAGDLATACPKFAESQRLDPKTGTLTGLALCHEKQGKNASAWAEFLEVSTLAQRANQAERAAFAKQHASDLEPKLSKLTITVDAETAKLAGLAIKRDDQSVRQATWGVALPVDPGSHTIEATANGKQKWTQQVDIGEQADTKSVAVPALEDDTSGNKTETPKTDDSSTETTPSNNGGGSKKTIGLVVGGVGAAALVAGTIFGIEALSKSSTAKKDCSPSSCGDASSVSAMSDAKSAALISDIGFGVGVVALGVGAYLFLTSNGGAPAQNAPAAPSPASKNRFFVTPFVAREGGGAAVLATF